MGCKRFDWLVSSSPIPVSLVGQKNDGDLLVSILRLSPGNLYEGLGTIV